MPLKPRPYRDLVRNSPPLIDKPFFAIGIHCLLHCFQTHLSLKHNLDGADVSQKSPGFFIQRLSRACPRLELYLPPGTLQEEKTQAACQNWGAEQGRKSITYNQGCLHCHQSKHVCTEAARNALRAAIMKATRVTGKQMRPEKAQNASEAGDSKGPGDCLS